jgi:hypothetical protein
MKFLFILIFFGLLISHCSEAQILSKKFHLKDSSRNAFVDANRALREYGFKVMESNPGNWVLLERNLYGNIFQTILTYKETKGITVETYAFYNGKKEWSNFERLENGIGAIESIVAFMIENNKSIPAIALANTPFWTIKHDKIKE